ncbi:MAG: hypothetical protein H6621_01055 [Halobacteriovoraceae bacterium]|nr:hypothetical protein [Halobacteriovoraceae bacterium]MCB9093630.1 hypothetical protein [Halobacteriovoraceae bacterium]
MKLLILIVTFSSFNLFASNSKSASLNDLNKYDCFVQFDQAPKGLANDGFMIQVRAQSPKSAIEQVIRQTNLEESASGLVSAHFSAIDNAAVVEDINCNEKI